MPLDFDWAATYDPISMAAFTLMAVALLALIIPAVKALEIVEIEIVYEDQGE